jgi:hypothetical protein
LPMRTSALPRRPRRRRPARARRAKQPLTGNALVLLPTGARPWEPERALKTTRRIPTSEAMSPYCITPPPD